MCCGRTAKNPAMEWKVTHANGEIEYRNTIGQARIAASRQAGKSKIEEVTKRVK